MRKIFRTIELESINKKIFTSTIFWYDSIKLCLYVRTIRIR